jgi:hypothetical protein
MNKFLESLSSLPFFSSYLPSNEEAEGNTRANAKIVEGNLELLRAETTKRQHMAEREKVQTDKERNEVESRKKDLVFFAERDAATKVARIAKAVAEETRRQKEEESRVEIQNIESEKRVAEEKKILAQALDRQADTEWSAEKNRLSIEEKKAAMAREQEIAEFKAQTEHARKMDILHEDAAAKERERKVQKSIADAEAKATSEAHIKTLELTKARVTMELAEKQRRIQYEKEFELIDTQTSAIQKNLQIDLQLLKEQARIEALNMTETTTQQDEKLVVLVE